MLYGDESDESNTSNHTPRKLIAFLDSGKDGEAVGEVYRVRGTTESYKVGEFRLAREGNGIFRFEFKNTTFDDGVCIVGVGNLCDVRRSYEKRDESDQDASVTFGKFAGLTARSSTVITQVYLGEPNHKRLIDSFGAAVSHGNRFSSRQAI